LETKNTNNFIVSIDFESLLKIGFAVIDIRVCEYDIVNDSPKYVVTKLNKERDNFYYEMLKSYQPNLEKEKDIYSLWAKILEHKLNMSTILKRDIAIKVAVFDYFEIVKEI